MSDENSGDAAKARSQGFVDFDSEIQRAENHWRRGDFDESLGIYESLLSRRLASLSNDMKTTANLTAADIFVIERLADSALLLGYADASDELFAGMAELNRQAGDSFGSDYATLKRIHLALGQGDLLKAQSLLESLAPSIGDLDSLVFTESGFDLLESRCRWPGKDKSDRAVLFTRLYLCMGRLLTSLGQYGSALAALERGLVFTGADAPDLARRVAIHLVLAKAAALLEKGELDASESVLKSVEAELDDLMLPGVSVHWRELAGKLALVRGDLGIAIRQYSWIQEVCRARDFRRASVISSLNLAHILIYLNQTASAEGILRQARAQAQLINDMQSFQRAGLMIELLKARAQSLAEGVSIAPSVSALWLKGVAGPAATVEPQPTDLPEIPQSEDFLTFFEDRSLAFRWSLARGDLIEAAAWLDRIKQIFRDTDSVLIALRIRMLEGIQAYYKGRWAEAEAVFIDIVDPLRALKLNPDLWQSLRFLDWCAVRLERPENERQRRTIAAKELLDAMSGSLDAPDRAMFLLNKWTLDEEYIAGEIEKLVAIRARIEHGSIWMRPILRWRLMQRLHSLMVHADRYKSIMTRRVASGHDSSSTVQSAGSLLHSLVLRPFNRLAISFLVLPDRVFIACSGWMRLGFSVCATSRLEVRNEVARLHTVIAETGNWAQAPRSQSVPSSGSRGLGAPADGISAAKGAFATALSASEVASSLAAMLGLTALLDGFPRRIRAMTIVPDDSLHGVPFAAIQHKGRYLAERFSLNIDFNWLPPRRRGGRKRLKKALTVGVTESARGFRQLTGVIPELDRVQAWLESRGIQVTRLVDSSASKPSILNLLPQESFLHIACHGVFKIDRPDESGFILVPERETAEVVSLRDLSDLDLHHVQHATLSSCWSADHFILPGRWIISLPETLSRSGAGSVMGCLWEVDDRIAANFMLSFYEALERLPRDRALREAQLRCMRDGVENNREFDASDPIYWAGFQLYGVPGRLRI